VSPKEAHEDECRQYNTSGTLQSLKVSIRRSLRVTVRTSGNINRQLSHLPMERSAEEIKEVLDQAYHIAAESTYEY
jgi:hypothetical protein